MTIGRRFDRSYFVERMETNRRLAEESDDPLIRDLHNRYVVLYRTILECEAGR